MDVATTIISASTTKSEAIRRLRSLNSHINATLYNSKSNPDEWTLETAKKIKTTPKKWDEDYHQAEKTIEAIEPIILYLPEELDDLKDVINKIRSGKNKSALLEIKIDRSLLAGAAISYAGKYNDYSIKSKLAGVIPGLTMLSFRA